MAKGNFRVSDKQCLYCGYTDVNNNSMPYKIGKGANKIYLCEKCFNKSNYQMNNKKA